MKEQKIIKSATPQNLNASQDLHNNDNGDITCLEKDLSIGMADDAPCADRWKSLGHRVFYTWREAQDLFRPPVTFAVHRDTLFYHDDEGFSDIPSQGILCNALLKNLDIDFNGTECTIYLGNYLPERKLFEPTSLLYSSCLMIAVE